jgi:caffeoyl-CoA O-methyltransferase
MNERKNKIEQYILDHTDPEDSLLAELSRRTFLTMLNPGMISGHLQGKVLKILSQMISPLNILEIGTFTGYSAICLAAGLRSGGKLHTIDINDEIKDFAKEYFQKANLADKIVFHIGNPFEIIHELNLMFDLVFIDADKREYSDYYKCIIEYLNPGGYIIADNALWHEKVIEEFSIQDADTKGVVLFNDFVQNDQNVENVLFPIRDGLMVIRKKI